MTTAVTRAVPQGEPEISKDYPETSALGAKILEAAKLAAQIKKLTAQYNEAKEELLTHVARYNYRSVYCGSVGFIRKCNTKWSYSPKIVALEKKVKAAMLEEQVNGTAIPTQSLSLQVHARIDLEKVVTVDL